MSPSESHNIRSLYATGYCHPYQEQPRARTPDAGAVSPRDPQEADARPPPVGAGRANVRPQGEGCTCTVELSWVWPTFAKTRVCKDERINKIRYANTYFVSVF